MLPDNHHMSNMPIVDGIFILTLYVMTVKLRYVMTVKLRYQPTVKYMVFCTTIETLLVHMGIRGIAPGNLVQ